MLKSARAVREALHLLEMVHLDASNPFRAARKDPVLSPALGGIALLRSN